MARRWSRLKQLLAPRLDIPFARDDANRFLPWFIALMVFLTGLFLAGGITVGEIAHHKRQDLSQWLTIQMPHSQKSKAMEDAVMGVLRDVPEITEINRRSQAEVAKLVAPWFGNHEDILTQLPLPLVIEARVPNKSALDMPRLRERLKQASPGAELEDHQNWVEHYLGFIRVLEWGAYLLAALVLLATTLMIVFTSKTALRLHQDAVWLLHSVGAMDGYIARQFQFNAFLLGMRGALMGITPAAGLFFLMAIFTTQFDAPLLPSLPVTGWHIVVWLMLPLVTGFLAMAVTRKTVLAMLQKMT